MNLNELQNRLLAAARAQAPEDRVPYAFEKRILARLAAPPPFEVSAWWLRGLWRAAAACLAICLLSGAWTFFSPGGAGAADELSQQFENTVFAAVDQEAESTW